MQTAPVPEPPGMQKLFKVAVLLAVAIVVFRAVASGLSFNAAFAEAGNDDIMRLMSVRDWLGGQNWFDMTQHRILPGEGLSLHWSRYVDLGIGGIVGLFALVLPMTVAEQFGAVLWPLLLIVSLILCVGFTTRHLLGSAAGAVSMFMVVCYPPLALGYFGTGQLDHHNLQIVLMTVAVLALVRIDRTAIFGAVSGIAAALSLAIGLEALFMVAAVSVLHVFDAAFGRAGARPRLMAFCIAIFGSSVLFFLAQTPSAEWMVHHCDELALPFIAIAGIGAASGLAGLALPQKLRGPAPFLGAVSLVAVIGFAVAWPLLSPCLQAPYANLPEETQAIISSRIVEALPLADFIERYPSNAASYFGPAIAVLVIASVMLARGITQGAARSVIGHLLVVGWIGMLASVWQMRQVVILATVVPVLTGYVVGHFLTARMAGRSGRSQLALYAVTALTVFQPVLLVGAESIFAPSQAQAQVQSKGQVNHATKPARGQDAQCYDFAKLDALNKIEPGTLLTGLNLGPRMIMATHHAGLSAPYHRSDAALTNGFAYQLTDVQAFQERLNALGADMFLVCRNSVYGSADGIGSRLAAGETIAGFTQLDVGVPDLMVFRIAEDQ